ncbi:MAG: glycosyltransferase family 2 protein [Dehalococcoidia bacterium]
MEPRVGIVCVNFNGAGYLGDLLSSLSRVSSPDWHLVLVDNGSWDDSARLVGSLGDRATLLSNGSNQGYAAAANIGVRHCLEQGFDHILFINPDTVVRPDFLYYLMQAVEADTMVAPKTLLYGTTRLDDTIGTFDWLRGVWKDWVYNKPQSRLLEARQTVDMASLCCLLVPSALFARAGFIDEEYFMYYEDFAFVSRAQDAGYEVVLEPRAVIEHRKSAASGHKTPFFTYYTTRNRMYLVRTHLDSGLKFALFLAYFLPGRLVKSAQLLARLDVSRFRALWNGVADYFRGEMGPTRYLPRP